LADKKPTPPSLKSVKKEKILKKFKKILRKFFFKILESFQKIFKKVILFE